MKKKAICIMMIIMLIITPCYRAYADAGTITIAGGTIGVGGVAGGALAGLAGPAVVAVFVGMMAVGMDVELTKQSQQAGMTKTQYVKSKIEQYCQEAGKTADVFYKGITNGTRVLKDGSLAFTDAVSLQIKQFINWLYSNDQVTTGQGSQTGSSVTINNISYPYDNTFTITDSTYQYVLTFSERVAIGRVGNDESASNLVPFSKTQGITGQMVRTRLDGTGSATTTDYNLSSYVNGYYNINIPMVRIYGNFTYNPSIPWSGYNGQSNFIGSLDGSFNPTGADPSSDVIRGPANPDTSAYDPTQGWPTVVNPGVVGQIPIPADTDITVNVREYLEKLQEILDQLKDRVIEGVDKADGIPKDYDIPDTVEANPTIRKQPPPPDSDTTPISNNDPPSPSTEPNIASGPLKFNLTEIFPFCIPFDIKDMIGLLEAEPVAPAYTVNWNIPIVNVPLNFTVDLSPWNSVATICRKMEMLLFIIGLAMVTRNLIRG